VSSRQPPRSDQRIFEGFVRQVYAPAPDIYLEPLPIDVGERFLLPALYGGDEVRGSDPHSRFDFLVVLEGPSVSFTKNLWKKLWSGECESGHDAVRRHRRIFFDWAFFREPQAELFRVLVRAPSTDEEFFRSVYITDIWKDGAFKTNRKRSNPGYREHWRSLLAGELRGTRTKAVIFVGRQAKTYGWNLVPAGTPRYYVPFPKRTKRFRVGLQQLIANLRADGHISCDTPLYPEEQGPICQPQQHVASHSWTLNDAINRNVFNVIPRHEQHIHVSLFYQSARGAKRIPVGEGTLDMNELIERSLTREVDGGFWLRFVHDTRDHGIYIQLNSRSPRRLFANVPASAISSAR
jgi:hypothetical protein